MCISKKSRILLYKFVTFVFYNQRKNTDTIPKVDFTNLSCWKFLQQLILEILKIPRHDGFLTIFNKEIVTKSCTHAEFVAKNMTKTYFVSFEKSFLVPCFQNSSIFKFQNNRNLQDFEQKIPQI